MITAAGEHRMCWSSYASDAAGRSSVAPRLRFVRVGLRFVPKPFRRIAGGASIGAHPAFAPAYPPTSRGFDMRSALIILIAAIPAIANAQSYYLDIYNTAPSSLVALAAAPAGSAAFQAIALAGQPVHGGGDSVTIAFDKNSGGCVRDLRLTFADGRVLDQRSFNVCKFRSYHTGRYWRSAQAAGKFAAQP
jgi:hypothetical protein